MARFEIDCGDGETWIAVEASGVHEAAKAYAREHAEEEGWSSEADVRVRDGDGTVRVVRIGWRTDLVVWTISSREVSRG